MSSASSSPWPAATPPPVRRRQIITDQPQVVQAQQDCQFNSGNNIFSCFPTRNTVVPQHQWASFVWNSRRPELTQTNLVDIFLFRADSGQQILHYPSQPNPTDQAGLLRAQVDDAWFGSDGLSFKGNNISYPFSWVIIRSDKTLDGDQVSQPIFTAVQTAVLDSVASSSALAAASASSASAASASLASASLPSAPGSTGAVQHANSDSPFPHWAIAVIVVLGFLAIAATCFLAFLILRRVRRRQQHTTSSLRNSMGSASPMMPRDMSQRHDSVGSPLLPPTAAALASPGGATASHDGASTISESGPFSGADAAIMADAFRKMLRKPDFAGRPVEEGESPEQRDPDPVLRDQLAEEGRDIRSVSSSRGVQVHDPDPGETRS